MSDVEPHSTVTTLLHPVDKPTKPIEITLAWYIHDYKVKAITNTTWYKPGMWLAPVVVQKLCDLPGWQVNMVDNDLVELIFGAAMSVGKKGLGIE